MTHAMTRTPIDAAQPSGGGCPFHQAASATAAPPASAPARKGVSRRGFLGFLGLAATPFVAGVNATAAWAGGKRAAKLSHGAGLRGLEAAARANPDTEARFGRMFKKLPAYSPPDSALTALARQMNDGKAPLDDVKLSDVAFDTATPSGYVYLGQFVDHDMTMDRTPLSGQKQDPKGMTNYDTPCFDLGSVYGGGPVANPELYDAARPGYLLVNLHDGIVDVPRDEVGAAFVGDPRNDENLIISQLQTVFIRLHNQFMDRGMTFEKARQQTRWHFQWVIVHDFLPRIVGQDVLSSVLSKKGGAYRLTTKFYKPRNTKKPYMPVEYSGAAYRYGHSMIRAEYEVHDQLTVPIFAADGHTDLRGGRPFPGELWIDWNYFYDIPGLSSPDDRNMARKMDSQVSLPLTHLPPTVVAPVAGAIVALAERNLLRGKRLGLPSGQDVAAAMGITPLTNAQLGLTDKVWKNKAPLWYYVLKEAELLGGERLGPVGGRIVAEVICSILMLDQTCYLTKKPDFNPGDGFRMGDLILLAGALDERSRIVAPPENGGAARDGGGNGGGGNGGGGVGGGADGAEPPEDPAAEAPEVPETEAVNPEAVDPLPAGV